MLNSSLRDKRLKSINELSSKLYSSKIQLNSSRKRKISIPLNQNSQVSKLASKVLNLPNEELLSSRRKIGLNSTKTAKKINLSMYSPLNHGLYTSRSRNIESFSLPYRKTIRYPITCNQALESLNEYLSDIEKREILEYKEIYYIGIGINKIIAQPNSSN
jgi:hypothetical protein